MRMRRKKNLQLRLENCREYAVDFEWETLEYGKTPEKHLINYEEVFSNANPVELEIGCGKGQFAVEIAKRNPDKNFLAVEINENVIVQAMEKAKKENLKNLRFMRVGAEKLGLYLPENSIGKIYLNFSCPFPKKRQAKHRLTHESFLEIYKKILVSDGRILQKTDNRILFESSIEQLSKCGFILENVSLDLHSGDTADNIMTEYEKKFVDLGQPIYRLEAYLKKA
ncbi:MAG: tRNA (guanosine(46)-N7)-methyltransferase TrmB [Oscillospiraceae bacterium]|nr:tRNA (guanosine(46)-N7)-methyltransferase TrmB [Oscillospiraceae bacterium]